MSLRKKLVSNVFYNFLDVFTISLLGYIFWIILGKFLLPAEYGVVSLIIGLFQLLTPLTTLGLMSALPKFVPDYIAKGQTRKIKGAVLFSIKLGLLLSLVSGLVFFIFSSYIADFAYSDASLALPLKLLLPILVFGTTMSIVKGGLVGYQEFKEQFYADLVGNVIKTVLTLGLLIYSATYLSGIIGFLSWPIVTLPMCFYYLYKRLSRKDRPEAERRKLVSYGIYAAIYGFMVYMMFQGGIVLLGFLDTMAGVGFFRVAILFGTFAHLPSMIISTSFSPNISDFWANKQYDRLKRLVQISMKYIMLSTVPIIAVFTVFSGLFVNLFFSPEYIAAASLFPAYLIGILFMSLAYIILQTFYYTNDAKFLIWLLTIGAAINTALCFILVPIISTQGASVAYLVAEAVVFFVALYKVNKKLKINFSSLPGSALATLIISILVYLIKGFTTVPSLLLLVLLVPVYMLLLLKLKMFDVEDINFIECLPSYGPMEKVKRFAIKLIRKEL